MRSEVTLSEACSLIVDCPHKTAPESNPAYAYAVGTKAVLDGRIVFSRARPVDGATYARWIERATPRPLDLILCREAPVGPVAMVPETPPVCLGQRTVLLRPNSAVADPRFLFYALLAPDSQARLRRLAEGSTVPHLNVAAIRAFSVSLPSMEDQASAAFVLGALDDKIDSNRRLARLLEDMAATLFRARFVDFVGVDEFEEGELGRIPRGWRVGNLDQLVEVTMGQSPPGSSYSDDPNSGLLLVQGMGGFGLRYPTSRIYTSAPTKRARAGATLMTVRAPVGAVNVARCDVCLGRGVAGIDSERQAFTEFLIRSLSERWASQESGTIFPAVNSKQIVAFQIIVPPEEAIAEFEHVAGPTVAQLRALYDETETLVAIRDGLLPKLVSGQIRLQHTADPAEAIEPMVA